MAAYKSRWSALSPEQWAGLGARTSPFSKQGIEFLPLGAKAEEEIVVHETGYLRRRPHWNYTQVFSPFWRLYYDLKRGHKVVFPSRTVALGPEICVLIPDHQVFDTAGMKPRPKFWCHFSHSRRLAPGQAVPIELRVTDLERELIGGIIRQVDDRERGPDRRRVYHYSLALLHLLLSRPELAWQTEVPEGLLTAARHIEGNYARPLYVNELARLAGMSETAFRQKFQAVRSLSPSRYIAQVRVREAARLLASTTLNMDQIAESTGFPNAAYLSRVFKRITGEPAVQFRRRLRETAAAQAGGGELP